VRANTFAEIKITNNLHHSKEDHKSEWGNGLFSWELDITCMHVAEHKSFHVQRQASKQDIIIKKLQICAAIQTEFHKRERERERVHPCRHFYVRFTILNDYEKK